MQSKGKAGDSQRWAWRKKPGLSMEYKSASKSFAASFRKSDFYDADDDESERDLAQAAETADEYLDKELEQLQTKGSFDVGNMESLKSTTSKAGVKVADISAKSSWMKDKVANLWSRKGKADEVVVDCQNESEIAEGDDVSYTNTGSLSGSPSNHSIVGSPVQDSLESSCEGSEESREGDKKVKDKKDGKPKTGWIRDQVSNLISKGRNYASGSGPIDKEMNCDDSKLMEANIVIDDKKCPELSASMMEHYNLKQKETELSEVAELKTKLPSSQNAAQPSEAKDKFSDIHESISKKILNQTTLNSMKENLNIQIENRPPSPMQNSFSPTRSKPTPSPTGSKLKKSKIKDFLNTRPPTTDLTHLPAPVAEKNGREKLEISPSLKAQAKKKFKFSTKLSFSELLHSQEVGQSSPEDESKGIDANERILESPMSNRMEEIASSSEEENIEIDCKENNDEYPVNHQHSVTYFKLWSLTVILYAYSIIPTHSFVHGLVLGALITYLGGCLVVWLFCPSGKSIEQYKLELKNYIKEQGFTTPERKPGRPMDPKALQKPRDLKVGVIFF